MLRLEPLLVLHKFFFQEQIVFGAVELEQLELASARGEHFVRRANQAAGESTHRGPSSSSCRLAWAAAAPTSSCPCFPWSDQGTLSSFLPPGGAPGNPDWFWPWFNFGWYHLVSMFNSRGKRVSQIDANYRAIQFIQDLSNEHSAPACPADPCAAQNAGIRRLVNQTSDLILDGRANPRRISPDVRFTAPSYLLGIFQERFVCVCPF